MGIDGSSHWCLDKIRDSWVARVGMELGKGIKRFIHES